MTNFNPFDFGDGLMGVFNCNLKVGDKIKNVGNREVNPNRGKMGKVTSTRGGWVRVDYDDGNIGEERIPQCNECYKKINKSIMRNLNNYITKLVDADTRALCEAGYLNGDLEPTQKAFDTIAEINFFANKAELIARAVQEIADEKAKK